MKIKLLILLFSVLLTSCMTVKKRQRIATAYMHSHPLELAELCAIHFKPQTVFKPGKPDTVTNIVTVHDSVTVDCPPSEIGTTVKVPCPVCNKEKQTITIHDTIEVADVYKEFILNNRVDNLNIENAVLQANVNRLKKEKRIAIIVLIGIAVLSLGWKYLKGRF